MDWFASSCLPCSHLYSLLSCAPRTKKGATTFDSLPMRKPYDGLQAGRGIWVALPKERLPSANVLLVYSEFPRVVIFRKTLRASEANQYLVMSYSLFFQAPCVKHNLVMLAPQITFPRCWEDEVMLIHYPSQILVESSFTDCICQCRLVPLRFGSRLKSPHPANPV